MKLYIGSNSVKPTGYLTVDIDPRVEPDIVSNVLDMKEVQSNSCDEIVAAALMEHIEWPDGFLAYSEMTRCLKIGGKLKISVPDMSAIARSLITGDNDFHFMGIIFGTGGRENSFQSHRYGYTVPMLLEIFQVLGLGDFDWWASEFEDASTAWCARRESGHIGEAQNIVGTKKGEPLLDTRELYQVLCDHPIEDFLYLVGELKADHGVKPGEALAPLLYQRIHYMYLDAKQRIRSLEQERSILVENIENLKS